MNLLVILIKLTICKFLKFICEKFNEIKDKYAQNNKRSIKCTVIMLIQVDSENEPIDEFQQYIANLIKILEKHNLSWVKYFSNDKITSNKLIDSDSKVSLKEISRNGANYDVILFKIGPATGWNIPRACMLRYNLEKLLQSFINTNNWSNQKSANSNAKIRIWRKFNCKHLFYLFKPWTSKKIININCKIDTKISICLWTNQYRKFIKRQLNSAKYNQQIIKNIFDKKPLLNINRII